MASTTIKKRTNVISPAGVMKYGHIQKPNTKFNENGTYEVELILTPEDAAPFIKQIEAATAEARTQLIAEDPKRAKLKDFKAYGPELDEADEPTGNIKFKFKQNATWVNKKTVPHTTVNVRIPIFDAKGKPIADTVRVGRGSRVKVGFNFRPIMAPTNPKTIGAQLSLQGIQILELVEYSGQSASALGFTEEEGYSGDGVAPQSEEPGTTEGDEGGDL